MVDTGRPQDMPCVCLGLQLTFRENMVSTPTLYEVLSCPPTATLHDIKRAYQRAALDCHPDRSPEDAEANERFRRIQEAWEVLRDPSLRSDYDRELAEREGSGRGFISEEVPLSDMDHSEEDDLYTYPCRCGEQYQVSGAEVGPEKDLVLECDGCSLKIRVHGRTS